MKTSCKVCQVCVEVSIKENLISLNPPKPPLSIRHTSSLGGLEKGLLLESFLGLFSHFGLSDERKRRVNLVNVQGYPTFPPRECIRREFASIHYITCLYYRILGVSFHNVALCGWIAMTCRVSAT